MEIWKRRGLNNFSKITERLTWDSSTGGQAPKPMLITTLLLRDILYPNYQNISIQIKCRLFQVIQLRIVCISANDTIIFPEYFQNQALDLTWKIFCALFLNIINKSKPFACVDKCYFGTSQKSVSVELTSVMAN